jgi:tripartite-type tricarboxylate transporter receptor subunit TctC
LSEHLGQQVVVDNRAGAGGNIGMGMAKPPPIFTILAVARARGKSAYAENTVRPYSFAPVSIWRHRPTYLSLERVR